MTRWTEVLTHRCFHSGLEPNGCLDGRRWSIFVAGWVGHVGNPQGVVQAVCEHGVMSLPFSGPGIKMVLPPPVRADRRGGLRRRSPDSCLPVLPSVLMRVIGYHRALRARI